MIGKTILRWLVGAVALIAIFIIIMLTPLGLHITLQFAKTILPGEISYDHASGSITGPIEFRNFKYTDGSNILSIKKVKFSWKPLQLMHRKIVVTHFTANNVHLTIRLAKTKQTEIRKKKTAKPAEKPYLLEISNAHVNFLSIGSTPNQYPVFIRHIRVNARAVPDNLRIRTAVDMSKPFPLRAYFNITGNLDRYTLYSRAVGQKVSWHLYGLGNSNGVFLNLNEGKTLGGTLSFDANINWAPQWQWDIKLNGSNLNFNELDPTWPKRITMNLQSTGVIKDKRLIFKLKTHITAPGTRIDLATEQKHKLNLKWDVSIAQLSRLYKQFKGSVQSKGEWLPDAKTPVIKGQITASNFSVLGYQGRSVNAKCTLYPKQRRASTFNIAGSNLNAPGIHLRSLQLQGKGTERAHQLKGSVAINGDTATFQMQGGLLNQNWEGQLQKLTLASQQYRQWQLIKPTAITLSKAHVTANNLCLKPIGTTGQLCLKGSWNANAAWQFSANGKNFNPGLLTTFFTTKLVLSSPSTIHATVSGRGKQLQTAKANILLHKGNFRYQLNGNYIASPLQQGNISLLLTQRSLTTSTQLVLSKKNIISASASFPSFSHDKPINKQRVHARIRAKISDFTPFNKTLKTVVEPKGQLSVDLTVNGKVKSPDVRGRIHLQNGSAFIPKLGIEVTKVDTNISSFSGGSVSYKITAYSKNQPITIDGKVLATHDGLKITTTINANDVLIMNTPEYIIYASPNLTATIQGHNVDLKGKVDIPKGVIQPFNFVGMTTLPSDQIVYTAGEPVTSQSTWNVSANVNVTLGKDVTVNTSGFNATVTGGATIIGHPKKMTLANGRVNVVKGTYSAYGRTLTITPNSYIQFINSPINNPNFNVRATKTIQVSQSLGGAQQINLNNIVVGVELRGSFRHPKISFFSVPENLSQADILSYLVLGYSAETTSGSNISLLLEAANTLGGKGTGIGGALSQIKQGLGLEELGIENETIMDAIGAPIDQQSAFVIGKRLTKNIYIRYSLGLGQGPFAPVNIFQLRYTLNRHWSIQTDSSSLGSGGDILYTIESN